MNRIASPAATAQWRISLCGRLAVQRGGASLTRPLPGRQGRTLFAYLVLNRSRDMTRDELEAVAWPSAPPADPRAGLSTLLARLRRVLGEDALSTGGSEVRLELAGGAWIDVEAAADLFAIAHQALHDSEHRRAIGAARQALDLTEGALLADVDAPWIEERRRELDELRLAGLEAVADAGLALGGPDLALAERAAAALVRLAPYRETGHALLMRCRASRGDTAEALRVYESLRTLLRDELGTVPSPALIALHDGLLSEGPAAAQPAGADAAVPLPAALETVPGRPFVGREDVLAELRAAWSRRSAQAGVVVLTGEAGIGKTRVSAELAHELHSAGATVLYGRCDEDALSAYQPFVEALGHYVASTDAGALAAELPTDCGRLTRLIPALDRVLPGSPPAPADSEPGRYALFEAVCAVLRRAPAPLLLILDDLQWADRPTLKMLRHVLRALRPADALVIATYRDEEATVDDGLARLLADVRREGELGHIALTGLTERETEALARTRSPATLGEHFLANLHRQSAGNPLFIEELTERARSANDLVAPPAHSAEDTLCERARELAVIEDVINDAISGTGGVAVIGGVPGIGKTALLRAAADAGAGRAIAVLEACGAELESAFEWGIVRQLLVRGGRERGPGPALPLRGAAALAASALHEDWEAAADRFAVEHGLYWYVAELSERRPLLLLVDDAQWADVASLRFLAHLAHRLGGLRVGLIVATREDADPERGELLDRVELLAGGRCLGPAPLSADAVSEVLERRFEVPADPAFTEACRRATGGIPLLLSALVEEIASAGIVPEGAAAPSVPALMPASVERWVSVRLARLPIEARRLAEAVAVVGPGIDLAWVAEIAQLPFDAASTLADDLSRATVLSDRRPVEFAHPLVEAAVRDALPAGRRAALHRRAYDVLSAVGAHRRRALNHALLCEPSGDEALVEALRVAARHAEPTTAVAMLRRAARELPGAEDPALLEALGTAQLADGDADGLATLERAREGLTDPRRRVAIDLQVGIARYERGEMAAAARTLRRGGEEPLAEDDELRVSLQAAEMTVVRSLADPSAEQAAIGGRLDALLAERSPGRSSVERLVLAQAAFRGVQAGDARYDDVLVLARRALPPVQDSPDRFDALALPLAAMAMYLSDEFTDVDRRLGAEIERAQRQGEHMAFATASFFRGFPRFLRGDVLDAAEDFQSALDAEDEGWAFALPSAHALRAMCAIERDELAAAGELLVLPGGDERWSAHPTFPVLLAIRGLWHNCGGRHEQAARLVAAAGARQTEIGALNPSALHWRVEGAYTALALGDADAAREMSLDATRRARDFGAPRALGLALRALGAAHEGSEGVDHLRESVSVLTSSGAALELAHSRFALGRRLRQEGVRSEAVALLEHALLSAEACGGLRLRRLATEELRVAGATPRPTRVSGRESLTPTERRVALLAAEGLSSQDIAQRLFVTRRTIETHLTQARAKLGVAGRHELAGALAED